MRTLPLVLALSACWSSSQPVDPPKSGAAPVDVAIASIQLADDCDADASVGQPRAGAPAQGSTVAGDCAGDCNFARACEQTQLQVSLRSTVAEPTMIAIRKIEILDQAGLVLGTLTARTATRWAQDGTYAKWDQIVKPGEVMAASYALTSPDWGALPRGRDPSAVYRVRVTVAIGGGEKTLEKQAIVSAFSDPNVVT